MAAKGNMSNQPGGFLSDIGSDMDVIQETPNGVRHSNFMNGIFTPMKTQEQAHEGALNTEGGKGGGNRSGTSGQKPARG